MLNIITFKKIVTENTEVLSFHMFFSHLDFLIYELPVIPFPFSVYLIDFMSFEFTLNNKLSSVILIANAGKNLISIIAFNFFQNVVS